MNFIPVKQINGECALVNFDTIELVTKRPEGECTSLWFHGNEEYRVEGSFDHWQNKLCGLAVEKPVNELLVDVKALCGDIKYYFDKPVGERELSPGKLEDRILVALQNIILKYR